ncbi:SCP-like protein [Ostertagia ostertagi]
MLLFLTLIIFHQLHEGESQQMTSPVTESIRTMVVHMHNYRRSRLAQGLVPNGRTGMRAPAGSNIYKMAIKQFWSEIYTYSINKRMIFTYTLQNRGATAPLRFTQMAWASTYEVGCGVQLCATMSTYNVVCRYSPRAGHRHARPTNFGN